MNELKVRSITKAASWRVIATLVTVSLVLVTTGRLELALAVGFWETMLKLALYYLHERAWNMTTIMKS